MKDNTMPMTTIVCPKCGKPLTVSKIATVEGEYAVDAGGHTHIRWDIKSEMVNARGIDCLAADGCGYSPDPAQLRDLVDAQWKEVYG